MVSHPVRHVVIPLTQAAESAGVHDELADTDQHGDHPDVADEDDRDQRDDPGCRREATFERATDRPLGHDGAHEGACNRRRVNVARQNTP